MADYELSYVISFVLVSLVYLLGLYLVATWPGGYEAMKDKVHELYVRVNDWLDT